MYPEYIDDFDVIIIGAGISGLVAAYTLESKDTGLRILVLEATDRVGGRRHTVSGNSITFMSAQNRFSQKLINELHIKSIPCKEIGKLIGEFENNKLHKTDADLPLFGGLWEQKRLINFLGEWESLSERATFWSPMGLKNSVELDKISMDKYVKTHLQCRESQNFIKAVVESSCGVDAENISVLFYLAYCNSTDGISNQYSTTKNGLHSNIIQGGAMHICDTIGSYLGTSGILYKNRVLSVHRKRYWVTIKTNHNYFKCNNLIIAIPPQELLKIEFDPPLSDRKCNALQNMIFANRVTFLATYNKKFWKDNGSSGAFISSTNEKTNVILKCLDVSMVKHNSLYGILRNSYSQGSTDSVLFQLRKYFGEEAIRPVVYSETEWGRDLNYNPVAVPKMGTMGDFHEIRRPLDRLFFAGTETSTQWYGHLEGAIQSGYRAAIELLYDYRPTCLTSDDIAELMPRPQEQIEEYKSSLLNRNWKMTALKFAIGCTGVYLIYRKIKKIRNVFFLPKTYL